MPFNGSGLYELPATTVTPAVATTIIDSSGFNTFTADLATSLSLCLTEDGQNIPTANLPMGAYRHTNTGDGISKNNYATINQLVNTSLFYGGASTAGTDDYVVTLPVSPTTNDSGKRYWFMADVANTGACTVNFNALGAKSIKMPDGTNPPDGYIAANSIVDVEYNAPNMIIMNVPSVAVNLASVQTLTNKKITGTFTGNVTGDVTGNVTGDVTGDLTGNADTATLAATVTTNANLTGDVTSVGNATSIAPGVIEASHHVPITAGTTYRYHASRLDEAPSTASSSYVLADFTEGASFVIPRGGTYRCRFQIKNVSGATTDAVIYKDGVLFGNVKSTTSTTYTTFNDDLIFATGDIVQLYYKSAGTTIASAKNFQILAAVELLG